MAGDYIKEDGTTLHMRKWDLKGEIPLKMRSPSKQPKPPSAQPSQASHHSSARGGGGGVRRASLEGGARRSSMQGGSPAGSRPRTTDSNGEVRRGSYGLSGKLQGSLRMANRRLSFAFGNAMTLKVESRSTNLCRCPATNPWTQLMSAHQGRTRVIQRRFNVSVPRAPVLEKASTLRDRSER